MNIRILSDLHLEFHADAGQSFLAGQRDTAWDVMVLAGDITSAQDLERVAEWVRVVAGKRPVLWVPGNHEYYGGSVEGVSRTFETIQQKHGIEVLEEGTAEVMGQRFVGTTLWFPHSGGKGVGDGLLGDFRMIGGFREWVGGKAQKAADFLRSEVRSGDVVITHHLPHRKSVAPRYHGSPLNQYFLHDLSDFVDGCGAKIWVHGHTHDSAEYVAGTTKVVCNPFGYRRYEENPDFKEYLTIEL